MSSSSKEKNSSYPILYYVRGRGRAEIIRLTLAASGLQWIQHDIIEPKQFEHLKQEGKLAFNQLPMVEFEGKYLVQSCAIARYFARRNNLFGDTVEEELQIDILFEGTRDFFNNNFLLHGFAGWDDQVDKIRRDALPKYLPSFEKILQENGLNGHLVGSKLSLADIGLLEVVMNIIEFYSYETFDEYPAFQKFFHEMQTYESILNYLNSPQRFNTNTPQFVNDCINIFFS